MPDNRTKHKEIPLSGKFYTTDPAAIGQNFQTLKNMGYTDTHIKGVGGMTKINVTAMTTCLLTKNAFHFKKSQPVESHVLAQVRTTAGTTSEIKENTAVIPATAAFTATSIWTDSTGFGLGRFSNAPDGQIIYANGVDTCIWGGNEMKAGAFLTSTAAVTDTGGATSPKDYTDIINNTKADAANVAVIGGGIDTYTVLMMHMDGADGGVVFTDSVGTHNPTAVGGAVTDIAQAKFGVSSGVFDGAGDYLTVADHADWYFEAAPFTIDTWVRFAALPAANQAMVLFSQRADASNIAEFSLKYFNSVYSFTLSLRTAGVQAYPVFEVPWSTPVINTWYHIILERGYGGNANDWVLFVNGSIIASATTLSTTYPNIAAAFQIGSGTTEIISVYPPEHSDTYIKATTKTSVTFWPYFATDPSLLLTGSDNNVAWASLNGTVTNQRFHIDLGTAKIVTKIYYENYHSGGAETDKGVQNFTFWGSNTAGSFAELTYATDTGWVQLTTSQGTFDQHVAADSSDPKYITVTNTTGYRYYAFKFADNYGDSNYIGIRRIGLNPITNISFNGWLDEFRISKGIARHTAAFTPPARPYSLAARTWLVGSPRPLQGLKYTVSLANTVASIMTGSEWNGTTWNALTLTDNTDTGASLAATGTVTFASTVLTAKPKYLEGYFLYWYQFAIDAGGAEISHATLDAPFQGIVDMWDGVFRDVARFYKYTAAYLDNTVNVLRDDYDSTSASTYSDLSSMGAFSAPNNCLEIGFFEKQTGLKIDVAPEYVNSTAGTMSIDYWDGTAYVSAGTITDGTSEGGAPIAKSGVVSWNNNSLSNETLKVVSNSPPLYYYRVRSSGAMDASVRVNYVGGISAQKEINYYKFPIFAQGRSFLCCDMAGEKNKALVSSKFMPQVYNGNDSVYLYFGEEGDLTCGTELFSQFGSSLYSLIMMFKDNEMWITAGQDIDMWSENTFLLSSSIGCPAPLTLKTINLHSEPGVGINRALAIWQGANGVYMSDGRAPIPIHGDIKEYFDRNDSRCIKASMVGDSVAFIDLVNQRFHWLFASGTAATTLNTELVYDIARNKWFEIDRTVDLQCGVSVHDIDGNGYAYGFLDTGYMERLDYGTTFDGNAIVQTFQFGDIPLAGLAIESRISAVRIITVAKITTTASITMTHYSDGCTTGVDKTMSPRKTGYRIAQPSFTDKFDGDPFHSLKFTITTNNETIGFEPLAVVATFHATHEDS